MDKITWKTFEHIYTEKTSDWYWIVGIVTICLAVISILLNNIIFAVLILVASFTLSLFASKKPALEDVTLSNTGILFGKTFYPFSNIEAFWVETRDNQPRLIFKSTRVFMPFITIMLEGTDPEKVEQFLRRYSKSEEMIEPFFEKLLVYLGF